MFNSNLCFYLSGDPFQYGGGSTVSNNVLGNFHTCDYKPLLIVSSRVSIPVDIKNNFKIIYLWMPNNRILLELFDQIIAPFVLLFLFPKRVVCLNSIIPLIYPFRIDLFFQMRMFHFTKLDSFSKKIKNLLGEFSAKRCNNLYCASLDHANDMIKYLSLKPEKVKVIHLGYDFNHEASDVQRTDNLLFLSVIRPYKNLHGLVDAVIMAKQNRPDLPIFLDIIGKPAKYVGIDDYMNSIHNKILSSDYPNIFKFHGALSHEESINFMKRSKCLVFPTLFEGFGLPLLEAMATSTPVISSNVNSLPEISNDTTVFIDINNVEAFSSSIIDLYENGYPTHLIDLAKVRSNDFKWSKTSNAILNNTPFLAGTHS